MLCPFYTQFIIAVYHRAPALAVVHRYLLWEEEEQELLSMSTRVHGHLRFLKHAIPVTSDSIRLSVFWSSFHRLGAGMGFPTISKNEKRHIFSFLFSREVSKKDITGTAACCACTPTCQKNIY